MKKEYDDLSIDEKKEYHAYKNLTLEIPSILVMILFAIILFPIYLEFSYLSYMFMFLGVYVLVLFFYNKWLVKAKKLFGL